MNKAILFIVLALFTINAGCGSSGGSGSSSSGSTAVTLHLGQTGASSGSISGAVSSSAVPAGVTTIRVTVTAIDMVTIIKEVSVAGQGSVTITLDIPNGPDRHILVEALSASGVVLYTGESLVDLTGEPLQVTVAMTPECTLYVDPAGPAESDCADINYPCRTITAALAQADTNMTICVAAGTYSIDSFEDFPLNLPAGTTLRCTGTGHSTIIDGRLTDGFDTIYGAADASISGCTVYGDWDAVAIDDQGAAITVDDCVINGVEGTRVGVYLSADSTVQNSTITNVTGVEGGGNGIYVAGGNPVISGNTLDNNYYGIYIASGSPAISGNTITSNSRDGIRISAGDPVINNNTLSCNSAVDLNNLRTEGTIDATNNSWDNVPPTVVLYPSACDGAGEDICASSGGLVDYTGAAQAPACVQ